MVKWWEKLICAVVTILILIFMGMRIAALLKFIML